MIAKKGIDYTKNIGFVVFIFGCLGLFVFSYIDNDNINVILALILIISIGSALTTGFILKAAEIIPGMKGAVLSFSCLLISILSDKKLYWTQVLFNNTVMPTSTVVFIGASVLTILFVIVCYRKSKIIYYHMT